MSHTAKGAALGLLLLAPLSCRAAPADDALAAAEVRGGWERLFDGTSLEHWRGFDAEDSPAGWTVVDGCMRAEGGGDLVTREEFASFELSLEWRVSPGGNSGVLFHVQEGPGLDAVWLTGPEVQILDDDAHPGLEPAQYTGSNYALHAAPRGIARPVGEFNELVLRVDGDEVEQFVNGRRVVGYTLGSDDWEARVAASKFASMPRYGRARSGRIALQNYGKPVEFRNVVIRRLEGSE